MARYLLHIVLVVSFAVSFFSCEDEKYLNSPDAQLLFSVDIVSFDTIFTTIGSTTRHFTVYNPYEEDILISRVRLAGGDFSSFRLNINGTAANEAYEVEVPARDSIFVFVEVTIDPNGQNLPMVVEDSIEFTTNANIQGINLVAYGQDFKLVKGETIETTTWTPEKPYLVYDYAYVDSTSTLTIDPGTKVYFHDGAGLYVKGSIVANGTSLEPVVFQSDRLEDAYEDVPDQWNGIILFSGSHNNVFNFATIKNANIGLQVGTIENEGFATVGLYNSKIVNMAYAGIFALKSKIYAYNDVVANCGYYAVALLVGGEYEFYHSTIANYWGDYPTSSRSTSSLVISNVLKVSSSADGSSGNVYLGDLNKAIFGNSIIYGNNHIEVEFGESKERQFNYMFDHCILQVPDTFDVSDKSHYKNVYMGIEYDPLFVGPYGEYDFSLDTLSPALDIGSTEYATMFPQDISEKNRFLDDGPDLGAFELIRKKKNED